jgi:hypothetical protein
MPAKAWFRIVMAALLLGFPAGFEAIGAWGSNEEYDHFT